LADSYGVAGFRADSPESLEETLKKAITLNKTALIEVSIGETLSPFIVEMVTKD
jgi:thiamine pyrophosphate-dependent acetolactate synthase large subunit-like protein